MKIASKCSLETRLHDGTLIQTERCDDWGLDTMRQIQVYEDEPARIKCPLFEHFLKYNYSTAHSAGLTLIWYWTRQDRDLEEPINFRLPENRISKEKDVLWFRPTLLNDTGNYTCMLRNTTYCSKVAFPLEVVQKDNCFNSPMKLPVHKLYLEYGVQKISCPNIDGFFPSNIKPNITWYMGCRKIHNFNNVLPEGMNLSFIIAMVSNNGDYTCVVTYPENGRTFTLTRTQTVKVVGSPNDAMPPHIYSPDDHVVYEKEPGEELLIPCKVYFSYLKDSRNEIWWTIDGKKPEDTTIDVSVNESVILKVTEDETRTQLLSIKKVTAEDLKRNYVCHARNAKGEVDRPANVKQKDTVEAVFDFIQRSRRMIVVLSPDYVTEKSISMLEFKLGVMCQNSIATKLIVVEYRPLEQPHPSILQLKESVSFVSWKGEKSKHSGSKFWKALRLALPLRSLSASSGWNESCSSQSDISLDHVQRRKSRLKEPPELQSSGRAAGASPGPHTMSKHRGKPSAGCRCCVTYCEGESQLRSKSRAEIHTQPQWETHLCKPVPQESETQWIQNGTRLEPPAPQISALALHHFTDLSNNNDFYIL
uniref:Interleukin-1 receptor accessory protein n=1 Tax=Capra hircus TaxID=9925 RepID=A0A8C2NHI8_CAPHI